ncbi:MAG: SOS response-associated peptidase [Pseudomonadota bacterium]
MCGRYQLTLPLEALSDLFQVDNDAEAYPPRYNIAPTQPIHVVRAATGSGRALTLMRWGLIPSFVKDPKDFPLLINARSETAAEKPAFRNAVRRRRALIPATGFYEWRREGKVKQPFFFAPQRPIAFAGIWETWCGPNGEEMETAAILTAAAEGVPAEYHDRMPLTVPESAFSDWLDPHNENGHEALSLTQKDLFEVRPVSRRLSNARNEGEGLMLPDPEPPQDAAPHDSRAAPPKKPKRKTPPDDDAPRLI